MNGGSPPDALVIFFIIFSAAFIDFMTTTIKLANVAHKKKFKKTSWEGPRQTLRRRFFICFNNTFIDFMTTTIKLTNVSYKQIKKRDWRVPARRSDDVFSFF